MNKSNGEVRLRQAMSRLDDAERLLLKPERSGLAALAEHLEASWSEVCEVELAVRAGADTSGWRGELEELRGRVGRVTKLLDHARGMVVGCQMVTGGGAYGEDGSMTASGRGLPRRVDEAG